MQQTKEPRIRVGCTFALLLRTVYCWIVVDFEGSTDFVQYFYVYACDSFRLLARGWES